MFKTMTKRRMFLAGISPFIKVTVRTRRPFSFRPVSILVGRHVIDELQEVGIIDEEYELKDYIQKVYDEHTNPHYNIHTKQELETSFLQMWESMLREKIRERVETVFDFVKRNQDYIPYEIAPKTRKR